jgi:hypothetical protein
VVVVVLVVVVVMVYRRRSQMRIRFELTIDFLLNDMILETYVEKL